MNTALLVFGTLFVTLILLAAARRIIGTLSRGAQLERLATLGRLSAQMAHDLKNPLAALKGAAQFLQEEQKPGPLARRQAEFLDMLVDQVDRLERVIDTYQRLGRLEPELARVDVSELVRDVVALQTFASPATTRQGGSSAPICPAARSIAISLARALENLVRNAFEAMPDGGALTGRRQGPTALAQATATGVAVRRRHRQRDERAHARARLRRLLHHQGHRQRAGARRS